MLKRILRALDPTPAPSGASGAAPAPRGKVLVYSPVPWLLGRVEIGIGRALQARGYQLTTITCGGGFSACEMENAKTLRPDCATCGQQAAAQQAEFGMTAQTVTAYLRGDDKERARAAAAAWDGNKLADWTYEGMPAGLNVARYLHNYYHAATYTYDAGHLLNARRCLESSILYFVAARRMVASLAPDLLLLSNGKNLVYFPFFYNARQFGVRTVTWDESPVFEDALIFNHGCFANEIHLEGVWPRWRDVPLSAAEQQAVDRFLGARSSGGGALIPIAHGDPAQLHAQLKGLGWDGAKPLVAAFPNIAWDTAVIGRDLAFESLAAWLGRLVQLARQAPQTALAIRIHPHEALLPKYFSTATPVSAVLRGFAPLPPNLLVVPPDSPVNSYALGAAAQQRLLYSGTLGLEFAAAGLSSAVCADVHYRDKGFTIDIGHEDELAALVAAAAPGRLRDEQRSWAQRYLYLYAFRHLVRIPGIDRAQRRVPDEWFDRLAPGASPYWEEFLRAVTGEREFDLGPAPA
jgi:hypothetical protein